MSELFGSPIGARIYDADYNELLEKTPQILHKMGQVAMQPLEAETTRQEGRLRGAQADKAIAEATAEREMAELSRKVFAGPPAGPGGPPITSMADKLDSLAGIAAQSGLITKATKLAEDASQIRLRAQQASSAQATQLLNQARLAKETTGLMASYFGTADSPEAWQRANELFRFQTGKPSPYASVPWSEALVGGVNDAALSAKDKAELMEKELSREGLHSYRSSTLAQRGVANNIARLRADIAQNRETRLAKSGGGKEISAPGRAEVDQATRLLRADHPRLENMGEAAFEIASEARRIRRQNPAITPAAAIAQALTSAQAAGDIQSSSGWGKTKAKFSARGKTPNTALPLPVKPADPSGYVAGRFYTNGRGMTGLWNGSKILTGAEAARYLSTVNSRDESDEEDDE